MNSMLLREKMRKRGYTQEKLAEAVGMDRSTINRKINGDKKGFGIGEACRIGRILKMSRAEMTEIFFSEYDG